MLCIKCNESLQASAKFCTNCGSPTGVEKSIKNATKLGNGRLNQFSNEQSRYYNLPLERFDEIFSKLEQWLLVQDFELQKIPVDEDTIFV